ncbi:unnamed protein product, partial [Ixodes persulcatus]
MAVPYAAAELIFRHRRRRYRDHRDAFQLPDNDFRRQYRLSKNVVRWLCDELRSAPGLRRRRTIASTMTVEQQVLCALRFFGTGSFQGMVATDEHLSVSQMTVSRAVRVVAVAIVECLGSRWINFHAESKAATKEGFARADGMLAGVVGCVDGTHVAILGPRDTQTFTKAAYWCRKHHYALNVMVVCDYKARIQYIDPSMPGGAHDSYVWKRSSLRRAMESGLLQPDEFLLGDSGYGLAPWLITPVPGTLQPNSREARFNVAHSSVRSVVERCIGLLKNRFRCLHKHRTLYHPPQTAATIIAACAVLHNVCIAAGEPEPEPEAEEGDGDS